MTLMNPRYPLSEVIHEEIGERHQPPCARELRAVLGPRRIRLAPPPPAQTPAKRPNRH